MRVGFACDNLCAGGSWHGKGGEYVLNDPSSKWRHGLLIFILFFLLLGMLITAINIARKFHGDDDDLDLLFIEKSSILGFQGRMANNYINIDKVSRDEDSLLGNITPSSSSYRKENMANDRVDEESDRLLNFQASSFVV